MKAYLMWWVAAIIDRVSGPLHRWVFHNWPREYTGWIPKEKKIDGFDYSIHFVPPWQVKNYIKEAPPAEGQIRKGFVNDPRGSK